MSLIFSVVVPFFNEENHIETLIKSLLSQDLSKDLYEIILVDNNSTDGSLFVAEKYSPSVRIASEKLLGSYAARNKGIRIARGQIIAFTDADCDVSSNWLSQADRIFKQKKVDILQGKIVFGGKTRWLRYIEDYEDHKMRMIFDERLSKNYFGHTNNFFVRKSVFDELGLFGNEFRGMDTEYVQRYSMAPSSTFPSYSPELVVRHLEIECAFDWIKKMVLYSRTAVNIARRFPYRPLSFIQRIEIFKRCWQASRYSFFDQCMFILCMFTIGISFDLSMVSFKRNPKRNS